MTTPDELIVIPETAVPSDVLATDQEMVLVPPDEVKALLDAAEPYVVVMFVPADTVIAEFTVTFVAEEFEFV